MQAVVMPTVAAVTAGVLIIGQMLLLLMAVLARRGAKQSLGEGDDKRLLGAVRRHGNFAENAAIFVAALALFEMTGGSHRTTEILAGVFLLGRISHAIGLSLPKSVNLWRTLGVAATVGAGVVLGVKLVAMGAGQLDNPF